MRTTLLLGAASVLGLAAVPAQADELRDAVTAQMPQLVELYKDLHAHPELSFQEVETAKKLAARARAMGFEVTEGGARPVWWRCSRTAPGRQCCCAPTWTACR